jgi:hypothetical protein
MMKLVRTMVLLLVPMALSSTAVAQGFDLRRLFFGAGLSENTVTLR